MIHSFEGDSLAVPADRPKQVQGHVRVDGVSGKLLGARVFVDVNHTDPTDLRVSLLREGGGEAAIINRSSHPSGAYTIPKALLAGDPNGHWTLKVQDLVAGDGGRISWRVELDATDGDFFVELDLSPELRETAAYRVAFEQAAMRWAEVIVGALGERRLPNGRLVENLLIFASAPPIDGPGQILGQAGPTHIRHDSLLPIAGVMRFDVADLARMADDGSLFDVILHEMGHVLGLGTLWTEMGLLEDAGTANPVFIGEKARTEYTAWLKNSNPMHHGGPVPVENTGGAGTRDAHWREAIMDTEIMTGWIDAGFNPLSRITVASLTDQGYQVNMDAADVFDRPRVAAVRSRRRCGCTRFVPQKVAA